MGHAIWILILVVIWIITIAGTKSNGLLPPVFYIMPLVLTVPTVLWYARHSLKIAYLGHKLRKLQGEIAVTDKKRAESEKKRHEAKQREIATLPPVQRMTARIETQGSSVYLYLQVSEEERAAIIKYNLDEVVFEDRPMYDQDDIADAKKRGEERVEAIRGYSEAKVLEREISKQAEEGAVERMRKAREQVRLIDYMAYPYTRHCKTPYEATQYAAKLKQSLPKLKELVDQHITHQSSETIQL
jgi:hypothetical protein